MSCSFRLYGEFVWPPAPGAADGSKTRQGLVEIHFDAFDPPGAKPGRLRAFLCWRPGQVTPSAGPPPHPEGNVFDLDDAPEWFAAHGDSEQSIWIHGYDAKKGGVVLAFRGAFLFEQMATAPDGSASHLRWPLVRSATYGKDLQNLLSELVIGSHTMTSTRGRGTISASTCNCPRHSPRPGSKARPYRSSRSRCSTILMSPLLRPPRSSIR